MAVCRIVQINCIIFLLVSFQQILVVRCLPGSCLAARHTECCEGCVGDPPTCLCDPACRENNDCCSDIDELTCRNPELDAAVEHLQPALTFVENITFHSASLHWLVTGHGNPDFTINGSYEIVLGRASEFSNSSGSISSVVIVPLNRNTAGSAVYNARLYGLEQGTVYTYAIAVKTSVRNLEERLRGSFETLAYPSIEITSLELTGVSSVRLTWQPPVVPVGTSIHAFTVLYHNNTATIEGSLGEGVAEDYELVLQSRQSAVTIPDLALDQWYSFRVVASYLDADVEVYEGRTPGGDAEEIFVPGSSLFQLVAVLRTPCKLWSIEYAEAVRSSLAMEVLHSIQSCCNCQFPRDKLQEEIVIPSCFSQTEDEPFIQVTYRARLLSTPQQTSEALVSCVEARRLSSEVAVSIQNGDTVSRLVLILASTCSMKIGFREESICTLDEEEPSSTDKSPSSPSSGGVSTSTLTIALLAEFITLMTLFLVVAMVSFCYTKTRRKWSSSREQCDKSSENSYSQPFRRERHNLEEEQVTTLEDSHNREFSTPSPPSYNQIITVPPTHQETQNFKLDLTELPHDVKNEI